MRKYISHLIGEAKNILLATDGSPYTEGAVQEAIFFSHSCRSNLIVLYVIGVDSEVASTVHAHETEKTREIMPHIDNIKKMASDHNINCEIVILQSYQPEKTIVNKAKKHNADIIIMGRHGKRGLRQLLVGSMTAKVIGQRFPKVLVVPKDYIISGDTILLATDGSNFSNLALKETISFAKKCPALKNIVVLSVAKRDSELEKAKKIVQDAQNQIEENKFDIDCEYITDVGSPAEIIVQTAREKDASMIFMGGYGKGLSKLLMGHVTERVIGKAHCAVLVVEK